MLITPVSSNMPPTTPRASATCCMARDPPSPDGLAPRPAVQSSSKDTKDISIDHGRSWNSTDVNELQAIFEDELLSDIQTNSMKLNRIRIDDNDFLDEADTESEADLGLRQKRSSHTLKAVTEKLRKHLSIDSALSKRHSRSSIGITDEEVERRAELKRIRQRRIADELSHESVYDDDARSLSSLLGLSSDAGKKLAAQSSQGGTSLAELEGSDTTQHLPMLREVSHLTMGDICRPTANSPVKITNFVDTSTSPTLVNSDGSVGQDRDFHKHITTDADEPGPKVYVPTSMANLVSQKPASELLVEKRLPSFTESRRSTKSAWRQSFTSEHRREGLRNLSQGHGVPQTSDTEEIATETQDANTKSDKDEALHVEKSHLKDCCGSMDFGGVDGSTDETAITHLQEMKISKRLASSRLQSSTSSPQLSSWGSHQRSKSGCFITNLTDHARRRGNTDMASIDGNLNVWSEIQLDDKSPFRPKSAAPATTRPSAVDSRFSFLSYLPSSKSRAKFKFSSSADEEEVFYDAVEDDQGNKEQVITPEIPGSINVDPATPGTEVEGFDPFAAAEFSPTLLARHDTSIGPSEASSFREREQELETLQIRFAERRVLSTPVSSKFREEFDRPALPGRKTSVLLRLARFARRSIEGSGYGGDGTVDRSDLLSVPIPAFDPTTLLATPGSPMLDEAEVFWGSAVKASKGKEVEKDQKKNMFGRKKSIAGGNKMGLPFFGKKKKGELSAAEQYEKQFEERMAVKELVMDSWEMEMEATAAKAKTKSKNIVKKHKPSAPDHRFPASWSRFSSHDREERVTSARSVEKVDVKDFANLGTSDNGDIVWCLAHDDSGHHTTIDGLHRKKPLAERIALAVNKELYEFDTQDDQRAQTGGRRGSLTVALETEYPELEILPLRMMDHEDIKKIEDKKEEFEHEIAKDEELDEIAKLLGGGFDGVMSGEGGVRKALSSTGASDWEDEMVMSMSSGTASRHYNGALDPDYYADCVMVTKSTFASTVGSPTGTPGGTLALRADELHALLNVPGEEGVGEFGFDAQSWKRRGKSRKGWTGEGASWEAGAAEQGSGGERKKSLGTMLMSKSVSQAELRSELSKREDAERENLLKGVEDAFGKED